MTQNVGEARGACSIVSHPPKIAAGWGSLNCSDAKVGQPPLENPERAATAESHPCAKGRARMGHPALNLFD
jgi:hypothetical protein